jgi:cytidylate kinase|tara:strand:+ start:4561 stop:4818 length:258 start_codon:yes stop_codon:yes gene_type:complete
MNETEPKSRTYIREWKRKDYEKNGDKIKAKNKAYYYKNKFGLDLDDMKLYDIHLPLVAKVMDNLNKLKDEKPELINAILQKYIVI